MFTLFLMEILELSLRQAFDLKSPQIDIGEDDASDVTINLLGSTNDMAIVYDEQQANQLLINRLC